MGYSCCRRGRSCAKLSLHVKFAQDVPIKLTYFRRQDVAEVSIFRRSEEPWHLTTKSMHNSKQQDCEVISSSRRTVVGLFKQINKIQSCALGQHPESVIYRPRHQRVHLKHETRHVWRKSRGMWPIGAAILCNCATIKALQS